MKTKEEMKEYDERVHAALRPYRVATAIGYTLDYKWAKGLVIFKPDPPARDVVLFGTAPLELPLADDPWVLAANIVQRFASFRVVSPERLAAAERMLELADRKAHPNMSPETPSSADLRAQEAATPQLSEEGKAALDRLAKEREMRPALEGLRLYEALGSLPPGEGTRPLSPEEKKAWQEGRTSIDELLRPGIQPEDIHHQVTAPKGRIVWEDQNAIKQYRIVIMPAPAGLHQSAPDAVWVEVRDTDSQGADSWSRVGVSGSGDPADHGLIDMLRAAILGLTLSR